MTKIRTRITSWFQYPFRFHSPQIYIVDAYVAGKKRNIRQTKSITNRCMRSKSSLLHEYFSYFCSSSSLFRGHRCLGGADSSRADIFSNQLWYTVSRTGLEVVFGYASVTLYYALRQRQVSQAHTCTHIRIKHLRG